MREISVPVCDCCDRAVRALRSCLSFWAASLDKGCDQLDHRAGSFGSFSRCKTNPIYPLKIPVAVRTIRVGLFLDRILSISSENVFGSVR